MVILVTFPLLIILTAYYIQTGMRQNFFKWFLNMEPLIIFVEIYLSALFLLVVMNLVY